MINVKCKFMLIIIMDESIVRAFATIHCAGCLIDYDVNLFLRNDLIDLTNMQVRNET